MPKTSISWRALAERSPSEGLLDALIAILAIGIGLASTLAWRTSAWLVDQNVPMLHDCYYHAVRILDAFARGSPLVFQYDAMAWAPEGGWVPWSWGYDSLLAGLLLLARPLWPDIEPSQLLLYLPLLFIPLSIVLALLVTRLVGLPALMRLTVVCAFAASPIFQSLHRFAVLDHHQVEQALFLSSLVGWLWWLQRPESRRRAVLLGAIVGIAPAFHSGLFFIHVASGGVLTLLWWRGLLPGPNQTAGFAISLLSATLLSALPSAPVWAGELNAYSLSWLHLLLAAGLAGYAVALARWPCRVNRALLLLAGGLVIAVIGADSLREALDYISGQGHYLSTIGESHSALWETATGKSSPWALAFIYTGWAWLWPLSIILALGFALFSRSPERIALGGFASLGLLLLAGQLRFANYGLLFTILLPVVGMQLWVGGRRRTWLAAQGLLVAAALFFAWPSWAKLRAPLPTANDGLQVQLLPAYRQLDTLCRKAQGERPPIVLADGQLGHYLRYHTHCAVMANNFFTSPRAREKVDLVERLLALSPDELTADPAPFDLILVALWRTNLELAYSDPGSPHLDWLDLARTDYPGLTLRWQSFYWVETGGRRLAFARIFERDPAVEVPPIDQAPDHPPSGDN